MKKGSVGLVSRKQWTTTGIGVLIIYGLLTIWRFHPPDACLGSVAWQPQPVTPTNQAASFQFVCQDPAVSYLKVEPPPVTSTPPRVLCLVLTHAKNHKTRLQAVLDTWGSKCDGILAASDQEDSSLHAVAMVTPPLATDAVKNTTNEKYGEGYWNIYDKLLLSYRYLLQDTSFREKYDWIVKADDDTYIIMENLRSFLHNQTQGKPKHDDRPIVYGRVIPWPRLRRFRDMQGWFNDDLNRAFGDGLYGKLGDEPTLRFSHGGPGYIMNWKYLETLVHAYFDSPHDAVHGPLAEDIASALTMLYHNVTPESTGDAVIGRERMHPESPQTMFENPIWLAKMHHGIAPSLTGSKEDCCSPTSISFHYVADVQMRLLHYQLYNCPRSAGA
eukprot:Nitzschia sp. Nitz4//scaffold115_size69933//63862//65019//NITZ4_006012-RA/size69933-processed-gene-0.75-mRNA-1//-1//CDS//3329533529//4791//frame0